MVGLVGGGLIGAALTALMYELRRRTASALDELSDDDRDAISAQFAQHSQSMRQQVTQFADTLAGDDPVLRERLRQFEGGEAS